MLNKIHVTANFLMCGSLRCLIERFFGLLPNVIPLIMPLSTAFCLFISLYLSFIFSLWLVSCLSICSFVHHHWSFQASISLTTFVLDYLPPWSQIVLHPFQNLYHHRTCSQITHECGMVVPMPALCQSAWVHLCANVSLVGSPWSGGQSVIFWSLSGVGSDKNSWEITACH